MMSKTVEDRKWLKLLSTSFFTYSFNKYLLRGFYMLSPGIKADNITDVIPAFFELRSS